MRLKKPPRLHLTVQSALSKTVSEGLPSRATCLKWARAALVAETQAFEITIRYVDKEEGQTLNRTYRGKDYPTNVLTFVFDETPPLPGLPLLGDLIFCHPVVAEEAAAQGKALDAHYAHLVVHGMLHLQGWDHEEEAEAQAMEAKECAILAELGFENPYSDCELPSSS